MKAAFYTKHGPPDVIECSTLPKPTLTGPHQVLIEIKAAGLNRADVMCRAGNAKLLVKIKFPAITGTDFAGVIFDTGDKVTAFNVGDAVFGQIEASEGGTCAEYLVLDTRKAVIARKPEQLSFQEAAAFGMAAGTAWVAMTVNAGFARSPRPSPSASEVPSQTTAPVALVIGASGACGHFAVQFARHFGCRVFAVCSGRNAAWVRELGASSVIDYTAGPVPDLLRDAGLQHGGLDLVLDFVGGDEYYLDVLPFIKKGGQYITAVGPVKYVGSTPVTPGVLATLAGKSLWRQVAGKCKYSLVMSSGNAAQLREIAEVAANGSVRPHVSETYPLERSTEAHKVIQGLHASGRVVVTVS